jgi:hypothetical protein
MTVPFLVWHAKQDGALFAKSPTGIRLVSIPTATDWLPTQAAEISATLSGFVQKKIVVLRYGHLGQATLGEAEIVDSPVPISEEFIWLPIREAL